MDFPLIPSGELFTRLTPAGRAEYFGVLSSVEADDIDLRSVYGRKGWLKRLSRGDPGDIEKQERLAWSAMSPAERYNLAYGNAVDRILHAVNRDIQARAVVKDIRKERNVSLEV